MEFILNVGIFRKMKYHIVSTEVVIISYVQLNPMFTYRYNANVYLALCDDLTYLFVFLHIVTLTSLTLA